MAGGCLAGNLIFRALIGRKAVFMGTRNLTCVAVDGNYKVAQYGQWDGYPSGQGLTILRFLRDADLQAFAEKVKAATFATDEYIKEINKKIEGEKIADWKARWPELHRDQGGKILQIIMDREPGIVLQNSINFAANSLFCVFAYVVDFDKGTFEVFEGYNKTPLSDSDRFFGYIDDEPSQSKSEFYPIRKVAEFKLDALPTDEEFLQLLKPDEDDLSA